MKIHGHLDTVVPIHLVSAAHILYIERLFISELDVELPARTMGNTAPSGMFELELDFASADVTALSDADLVDAAVGFEAMVAWAAARQFAVLAEFGRRSGDGPGPGAGWAGDEIALALTVSRGSGAVRLAQARRLDGPLRATRDLLQAGRIDVSRARLIVDRCAVLDDAKATAVQERVLAKAPDQTWAQLAAALRRAILAVEPEGAAERHQVAKKERRVDVFPDDDGMATLWARMSARTPGKLLITVLCPTPR